MTYLRPAHRRAFLALIAVAVVRCGGGDSLVTPSEGLPAAVGAVAGANQTGQVGQPLAEDLVVVVTDSRDRPVKDTKVQFAMVAGGTGADLIPDTAVTDANGQARSKWVLGSIAGAQRVEARVLGQVAGGALKIPFDATAMAGPVDTILAFRGDNQNAIAGQTLADSLVVLVTDQFGNPVAGQSVAWSISGGGSFSPPTTTTGANGQAAVSRTLGLQSGIQTATATVTGAKGSPLVFTHTATAGGPTALNKISGDNQQAPAGLQLPDSLVVQVIDGMQNGVPGVSVNWVVVSGGGAVAPQSGTTNAQGRAVTYWTLGPQAGSNSLTAVVTGLPQVTFNATGTAAQPTTIQAISTTTQTGTAGTTVTGPPSVKVTDVNANPVQGVSVAFTVTAGGGSVSDGTTTGSAVSVTTNAQGVATLATWTLGTVAGANQVQASASGSGGPLSGSPVSFNATGNPGPSSRLAFLQHPSSATAGQTITPAVSVRVEDQYGNLTASSAAITLSIANNPGGGTLSGGGPVAASGGMASFGSLSIDRAGTGYTLRASATGLTQAVSNAFDIQAGAPSRLVFTQQPTSVAAGALISPPVVVAIQDGLGNTVATATNAVTLALGTNPSGAVLSGGGPASPSSGVATFATLSLDKTGTGYTLVASATGLTGATSTSFNVGSSAPARLAFVVEPSTVAAGATIAPPVQVAVLDVQGNLVSNSTASVAMGLALNPGGSVLTGTSPVNAVNGVATFSDLSLNHTGSGYTLEATSTGLVPDTSIAFDVTVGSGLNLVFTTQPSSTTAGTAFSPDIVVTARDGLGNTVTSFTGNVSLSLANNPGGATLNGTTQVAAVAGVASFPGLSINQAGQGYTMSAAATGATSGVSAAFNISPGPAAALVFLAQPGNTVAGSVIAPAVQVAVRDAFGNTLTGDNITSVGMTIGTNPGGGTLGGTIPRTVVAGVATFDDLVIDAAGSGYTLVASGGGLPQVTSVPFDIQVGNGNRLAFLVQPSNSSVGATITPAIQVAIQDAVGNTVTGSTDSVRLALTPAGALAGTVGVRAVNGVATFSNVKVTQAGTGYTLTAFAPVANPALVSATSTSFDVTANTSTTTITGDQPDPTQVGQAYAVTFTVTSAGGTPTGGTVTVSDGTDTCGPVTVTAGFCNLMSTTAGAKTLVATYSGDANFTGSASAGVPHTVNQGATTTQITSDLPDPSVTGQPVAVNWTVAVVAPASGTPGGTVTVTMAGGSETCSAPIGAGTCQLVPLSIGAGNRAITASYGGDTRFTGSTVNEPHGLTKAGTATAVTNITPNPLTFGQSATVDVSVSPAAPGGGTPTGTVTVSDGVVSCQATLSGGLGSCQLTPTSSGTRTLTASYPGDANYTSSSVGGVSLTVNPAGTTTSITSALPNPASLGGTVTVSVTVAAASGTLAGGSVTVQASPTNESCTISTVPSGSCGLVFTTAGPRTVTASYSGTANFLGSTSPGVSVSVSQATPVVTITGHTPNPSVTGQPVAVSVTVAGSGATPTGQVTVSDGVHQCVIGSLSGGAGGCNLIPLIVGTRTLVASYAGDANYGPATSAGVSHTVNQASTSLAITGDPTDPSVVGLSYAVTYSLGVTLPGGGAPSGTVTVSDGQGGSCTATVAAGGCSLTSSVVGSLTLTASYPGDANYLGSTSAGEPHTVTTATTTTAITGQNPATSVVGQTVSFSVTVTGGTTPATGTVTVSDGTQSCQILLSGGTGSCGIAFSTSGTRSVTASYPGDATHGGSTSAAVSQPVTASATATAITGDTPDPSSVGQSYTVSYTVTATPPGAGTPTGNVTVTDGQGGSCIGTVAAGSCSLTSNSLLVTTLTATYAGDGNFAASTSPGVPHTVVLSNTTTTITSHLPDPSVTGQSVTFDVSVSGGLTTPTGTVTVSDGTQNCQATLSSGTGSCSIAFSTAGPHSVTATYGGDASHGGSSSTPVSQTVNQASTTTAITADPTDPSVTGQSYAVSYSVVAVAPGAGTPTGNVTVSDGQGGSCTAAVAAGGCSLASTVVGGLTLTASYAGDANFLASVSAGEPHTVNQAGTTTAITGDTPDPSVVGQPYAVSYTVSVVAPGSGIPTGTVTVSDGQGGSCSASVAAGQCSLASAAAGPVTLIATYAGDPSFSGSASGGTAHAVNPSGTTTAITADPTDPSQVGQSYTVSYSVVAAAPGAGTPGGNVTVSDGQGGSCTATVAAAGCSLISNVAGSLTLVATYAGDANFTTSTSAGEPHSVTALATTTTIANHTPDPSLVGQSVSFDVTVTSTTTPTGTVTVSDGTQTCQITLSAGAGSCGIAFATAGGRTVTATYGGDAGHSGSTSVGVSQTVNQASTTTAITADPTDPSVVGQSYAVSYSVSVTAPGAGTPTGNVTVSDGLGGSCTATVAAGGCSLATSTAGSISLTASYAGDANYTGSTSPVEPHTVNQASPVVSVTGHTPDPSVTGQGVTVNVTVTGAGVTPTGSVTVSAGTDQCVIASLTAGAGSCNLVLTSAGAKSIVANYAGDANYLANSSAGTGHTVNLATTSLTITGDNPDPSVLHQPYTVSWTVAVTAPGAGTPTGTVTVSEGTWTCSAPVAAGSCVDSSTTVGTRTVTVTYAGDANFQGSSANTSHTVNAFGAAAALAFNRQPSSTKVNNPINPSPRVAITDGFGNIVTTATNVVSLIIDTNPGGGTLTGGGGVAAVSGLATFAGLSIDQVGNGYTLRAQSTGLTDAVSASFNITP